VAIHFTLEDERLRISCTRPERKEEEEERKAFDRAWNGPQADRRQRRKHSAPHAFAELALRLEKPLPNRLDPMPIEEVAGSLGQRTKQRGLNVLEEIRQYNLEMLRLIGEERVRKEEPESPRRAGAAA